MADTVNALSSETGLPADLVHKGLKARPCWTSSSSISRRRDVCPKIQAAIPNATDLLNRFRIVLRRPREEVDCLGALTRPGGEVPGRRQPAS